MSPHPEQPEGGHPDEENGPAEAGGPAEDAGRTDESELAGPPGAGDGMTEEFEAEFGEEFGADVADELTADELAPEGLEAGSQETLEADVLALADEEEAREAAARDAAAALEARAGGGGAPTAETEASEAGGETDAAEDHAETDAADTAAGDGEPRARDQAAVAPPAELPPAEKPAGPEPAGDGGADEPPKPGIWPRFVAASLVIVISIATATSVSILLYLSDIAEGLGGLEGLQSQLEQVEGGNPQTILILGSDARPEDPTARSDTTMLLRLDPDQDAITLLSLPRDLKVNIPGRGIGKLNDAYTAGGPKKTVEVVKQLTGLKINHVVNVDFQGFSRAISAIDCVYVDVDRRYFHTNEGLAPEDYFSEIDIKAGYQMLCGDRGLQYVRYRHTDNDLVRGARQQDFMREARQKIGPSRLFRDREQLIKIFTRYTTSDIDDPQTMLQVLKLFLANADAPINQVHFEGKLGDSYVTASNKQVRTAVQQFLGGQGTPGPIGGKQKSGGGGGGKQGKQKSGGGGGGPSLIDTSGEGLAWAEQLAPRLDFPVFYPTKLAPGSTLSDESRKYRIEDTDGRIRHAYKLVVSIPGDAIPAEYYGVMGISWLDPPILENPSETREIGGREYMLFYDGGRLRLVGWTTNKAAYWLNNTLLQTLEKNEMLAIAQSMRPLR